MASEVADQAQGPAAVHIRNDKFIISCAARTGSTMLQQMLRSHPDILCHGEVVQPDAVGPLAGPYWKRRQEEAGLDEQLWRYMSSRPRLFLYDIIFDRQGRSIVGFKFKTDEAYDQRLRHAEWVQTAITKDTDIKIIRLRRRDLLAQYISHQIVLRQTRTTQIADEAERPQPRPFSAEPDHAIRYFEDVVERERRADEDYASHRQFHVYYEDLLDESASARESLLRFLEVRPRPMETNTKKVLKDTRALLQNRDELLTELARAGYPRGLHPPDERFEQSTDA